jgi:NAD(P)-dependent dehydrogenase (short-subunit alcohol dehydrogenase family)
MKAIVTGHTKGLGAALAHNLLARGVPVLGMARTRAPQLAADYPDLFDEVELDLADGAALGGWLAGGALKDYLNVAAPLALSAAVARASSGAQRRILHISSGAGRNAYPGWSVYCGTKAALDHHARAVAMDDQHGVKICSLAPGVIDTGMQAEIRATPTANFPMRQRFVDLKETGSLADADECAERLVDYLLGAGYGDEVVADLRSLG